MLSLLQASTCCHRYPESCGRGSPALPESVKFIDFQSARSSLLSPPAPCCHTHVSCFHNPAPCCHTPASYCLLLSHSSLLMSHSCPLPPAPSLTCPYLLTVYSTPSPASFLHCPALIHPRLPCLLLPSSNLFIYQAKQSLSSLVNKQVAFLLPSCS